MIEILKRGKPTRMRYKYICKCCNSEMLLDAEDIKAYVCGPNEYSFNFTCPVCQDRIASWDKSAILNNFTKVEVEMD